MSTDITQNIGKYASVLSNAGASLQESLALYTGAFEGTRQSSASASGLKVLTQRLTSVESTGTKIDSILDSINEKAGTAFSRFGDDGHLKDIYSIFEDIVGAMDAAEAAGEKELSLQLQEAAAGKNRANVLASIADQWEDIAEIAGTTDWSGWTDKQYEVYEESLEGMKTKLKATWQDVFTGSETNNMAKNLFSALSDATDRYAPQLEDTFANIAQSFNDGFDAGGIVEGIKSAIEGLPDLLDIGSELLVAATDGLLEILPTIGETLSEWLVAEVPGIILGLVPHLLTTSIELGVAIAKGIVVGINSWEPLDYVYNNGDLGATQISIADSISNQNDRITELRAMRQQNQAEIDALKADNERLEALQSKAVSSEEVVSELNNTAEEWRTYIEDHDGEIFTTDDGRTVDAATHAAELYGKTFSDEVSGLIGEEIEFDALADAEMYLSDLEDSAFDKDYSAQIEENNAQIKVFEDAIHDIDVELAKGEDYWMKYYGEVDEFTGSMSEATDAVGELNNDFDETANYMEQVTAGLELLSSDYYTLADALETAAETQELYNYQVEQGAHGTEFQQKQSSYQTAQTAYSEGKYGDSAITAWLHTNADQEYIAQQRAMGQSVEDIYAQYFGADGSCANLFKDGADGINEYAENAFLECANYADESGKIYDDYGNEVLDVNTGVISDMDSVIDKLADYYHITRESAASIVDAWQEYGTASEKTANTVKAELVSMQSAMNEVNQSTEASFLSIGKNAETTVVDVDKMIQSMADAGYSADEIATKVQTTYDAINEGDGTLELDSEQAQLNADELEIKINDAIAAAEQEATLTADNSAALTAIESAESAATSFANGTYCATLTASASGVFSAVAAAKASIASLESGSTGSGGVAQEATGTGFFDGGYSVVNEEGPELIVSNGKPWIAGGGYPTITEIPRGSQIYPADVTQDLLAEQRTAGAQRFLQDSSGLPQFYGGLNVSKLKQASSSYSGSSSSSSYSTSSSSSYSSGSSSSYSSLASLLSSASSSSVLGYAGLLGLSGANSTRALNNTYPYVLPTLSDLDEYSDTQQEIIDQLDESSSYLEGYLALEQARGDCAQDQVKTMRKMQDALYLEWTYLESIGGDAEEILSLKTEWYELENDIADVLEDELETQKEYIKTLLDERIQAVKDEHDAVEDQLRIEEALLDVEEARAKKVAVFRNGQWVYESDKAAIATATKAYEDTMNDYLYEQQISEMEDIKDSVDGISDDVSGLYNALINSEDVSRFKGTGSSELDDIVDMLVDYNNSGTAPVYGLHSQAGVSSDYLVGTNAGYNKYGQWITDVPTATSSTSSSSVINISSLSLPSVTDAQSLVTSLKRWTSYASQFKSI